MSEPAGLCPVLSRGCAWHPHFLAVLLKCQGALLPLQLLRIGGSEGSRVEMHALTCYVVVSLCRVERCPNGIGRMFLQEYKALLWFVSLPLSSSGWQSLLRKKYLLKIQNSASSPLLCLPVVVFNPRKGSVTVLAVSSSNPILFHISNAVKILIHHK